VFTLDSYLGVGPTFINAKGVEVSEIDYFLYKTTAQVLTEKIDDT
jgi:hypothetical protein